MRWWIYLSTVKYLCLEATSHGKDNAATVLDNHSSALRLYT